MSPNFRPILWRGTGGRETGRKGGGRCTGGGRRGGGKREKIKGGNYATLRNISQSKKCKKAGANKYREIQERKKELFKVPVVDLIFGVKRSAMYLIKGMQQMSHDYSDYYLFPVHIQFSNGWFRKKLVDYSGQKNKRWIFHQNVYCPGGGTQQIFVRGGSAPKSSPLPFYIPFLTEKAPFSFTFHWKMVPFSHTYLRALHPFSKPLEGSLLVVFK